MDAITRLAKEIAKLWRAVRKLQITGFQRPTWLAAPLTAGAWTASPYSTTAKTLIDLSAVFGVPANIKAVLMLISIRDSGSAGGQPFIVVSPNSNAQEGPQLRIGGVTNDELRSGTFVIPCDANGDVYYQIAATGVGFMDVWLQIWGYWL